MEDEEPILPGIGAGEDDGDLDQGRRYWKAAIAHLAPQKREAAWEFYLDRLESSAAADTLGGVMLLLEAHLAFFDGLPAALGAAAQRIETALKPSENPTALGNGVLPAAAPPAQKAHPSWKGGRFSLWTLGWTAVISGVLAVTASVLVCQRFSSGQPSGLPTSRATALHAPLPKISVEPWNDPGSHRAKGCVVVLKSVAWAESSRTGDARVFVYSPVEEIRQNLRSLEASAR